MNGSPTVTEQVFIGQGLKGSAHLIPRIENEFIFPAVLKGFKHGIKSRSPLVLIAFIGALQRSIFFSE
jgi:hypothetical protein